MNWPRRTLGELMTLDVQAVEVDPESVYPIVGVLNRGRGLLYRPPIAGIETAYPTLNRVRPNQVVYSRLKAFEGAITVVPATDAEAFASGEFPTFTCGPGLLPSYFALMTTLPAFWSDLQRLSTGMGGRRERVKPAAFLTIEIPAPDVEEQARFVDLMASVDALTARLVSEMTATDRLLSASRNHLMGVDEWPVEPLGRLTTKIGSGATPRGGKAAYVETGVALIRSQNVHDLNFVAEGLVHITDAQAAALGGATVESHDVLINITGASVNRVCRAPRQVLPARVNQHVAILRCDERYLLPDFLAHLLRRADIKARLDLLAESGSTRQAITKAQLKSLELPRPSIEVQREILESLGVATAHLRAMEDELRALQVLRADLLSSVLSGHIEIPDDYFAAISEVA